MIYQPYTYISPYPLPTKHKSPAHNFQSSPSIPLSRSYSSTNPSSSFVALLSDNNKNASPFVHMSG